MMVHGKIAMAHQLVNTVRSGVCAVLVGVAAPSSHAQTVVFNFESTPAGLTTPLVVSQAGLTLTVHRAASLPVEVVDHGPGVLFSSWGRRAVGPPAFATTADPFVLNLSAPAQALSLQAGDFGIDSDTMTLRAWSGPDGTGALLDTQSFVYGSGMSMPASVATLSVFALPGQGVGSVTFTSVDSFSGDFSVLFDNVAVTPVPAPGALLVLSAGAMCGAARRRRRGPIQP